MAKIKKKIKSLCFTENVEQTVPDETLTLKPNVNLSQLSVPQFCGDLTKWNAFYQLFKTLKVKKHKLTNKDFTNFNRPTPDLYKNRRIKKSNTRN